MLDKNQRRLFRNLIPSYGRSFSGRGQTAVICRWPRVPAAKLNGNSWHILLGGRIRKSLRVLTYTSQWMLCTRVHAVYLFPCVHPASRLYLTGSSGCEGGRKGYPQNVLDRPQTLEWQPNTRIMQERRMVRSSCAVQLTIEHISEL